MKQLLFSRSFHIAIALLAIGSIVFMVISIRNTQQVTYVSTVAEQGVVEQLVSVSGIIEAEQSAELAFPTTGIVSAVAIAKGDVVQTGDVLVTLEDNTLQADRQDAVASLARAVATRDELLAGPQSESRLATAEGIVFKEATLETVKTTQAELVANAYRTLLSSDLTAISPDPSESAAAPTITGTYTCTEEGSYFIETYASNADSGYSFRLSGLQSGTYVAASDQLVSFGDCGLNIQFDENSRYSNTDWVVTIPNRNSAQYITNRNAFTLAQTQAANAITVAERDLALTRSNAVNTNAPARSEAIARANADIASANARIARIDALVSDRTIRAPFDGTIVDVDILPGETVTTVPVVTIIATSEFELTARIPEIDIGKLQVGQTVRAVFDARDEEVLHGTVDFISLQATEIDGVAYYEAIINLDQTPDWMRSGLNADIDIITINTTDNLRLPKRFVTETDGVYQVVKKTGNTLSTTTVRIILEGNDGFVAISGINRGDVIVAP